MSYTQAEIHQKVVTLKDDAGDVEAFVHVDKVLATKVNWLVDSSQVTLVTGAGPLTVTFRESDHGQECSDFISDYFKAVAS
jgi:hypothetical protein